MPIKNAENSIKNPLHVNVGMCLTPGVDDN